MSTPDDPTRRIPATPPPGDRPPAAPGGRPPVPPEREVVVDDEPDWRREVLDRLDSLRTWLVVVGLISLLALGLAAYTLLTAEEEDDTRAGASREQVRELEDRVDEVESQTENRASERAVDDVRQSQEDLAERVQALEDQPADEGGDTQALEQAIEDLQGDVQSLDDRLQDVEERQDQQEQQQQP